MKTIELHFNKIKEKNPSLGDYSILYRAVKGKRFKEDAISRWFTQLVDINDYDRSDRRELIRQLVEASQTPLRTTELGLKID